VAGVKRQSKSGRISALEESMTQYSCAKRAALFAKSGGTAYPRPEKGCGFFVV